MRNRALVIAAFALGVVGCPSADGKVDPGSAKVDDLIGYWRTVADDSTETIFGFATAEAAPAELPLKENNVMPTTEPVSAVYEGPTGLAKVLKQLTTFSVSGGAITQTVLVDENAEPGKTYSTKIFELVSKKSITLESKRDPSGKRTYTYSERCPVPNGAGWHAYSGVPCVTYFSIGSSMAFDNDNDLHSVTGQVNPTDACQVPTFTDITKGCIGRLSAGPGVALSSMAVGTDNVIRLVWMPVAPAVAMNIRERPAKGDTWAESTIDPMPGSVQALKLLDNGTVRLVAAATSEAGVVIYRWSGNAWQRTVPKMKDNSPIEGFFLDARLDLNGKVLLGMGNPRGILRETDSGFEALTAPTLTQWLNVVSVYAAADGSIHAIITTGNSSSGGLVTGDTAVYGVLNGTTWSFTQLPYLYTAWIVPPLNGEPRYVAGLAKAAAPAYALYTVTSKGVRAELVSEEPSFGRDSAPAFFKPDVVWAKDGSIAVTFNGQRIYVRRPEGPVLAKPAKLKLDFQGSTHAHVVSDDGTVDCSTDCEVTTHVGARPRLTISGTEGYIASVNCQWEVTYDSSGAHCFWDVVGDATLKVTTTRTPVAGYELPGANGGQTVATNFALNGGRRAFVVASTGGGAFTYDGQSFALKAGSMNAISGYDTASKLGWLTDVPSAVTVNALGVGSDGTIWAMVNFSNVQTFGTQQAGTANKTSWARLTFDSHGAVTAVKVVGSAQQGFANVTAAAVDNAGNEAFAMVCSTGFSDVSLSEQTVLYRIDAVGTVKALPISTDYAVNGYLVVDGARTLFATGLGPTKLVAFDAMAKTGETMIENLRPQFVSISGDRLGVALVSVAGMLTTSFGGEQRTGFSFLVEYGPTLTRTADVGMNDATTAFAFTSGGGAIAYGPKVRRLGASLAEINADPADFVKGSQLQAAKSDGESLFVLVMLNGGALINGVLTVPGQPRSVLVRLKPAQ